MHLEVKWKQVKSSEEGLGPYNQFSILTPNTSRVALYIHRAAAAAAAVTAAV